MGHQDQEAKEQEGSDQATARHQGQPSQAQEEKAVAQHQLVPDRTLDLVAVMGDLGPTGFQRAVLRPGTGGTLQYLSAGEEDDG
tara:strand:+ start:68 stop:319 length:252 start_codon:yes stop_codon:yes gene_type:complete